MAAPKRTLAPAAGPLLAFDARAGSALLARSRHPAQLHSWLHVVGPEAAGALQCARAVIVAQESWVGVREGYNRREVQRKRTKRYMWDSHSMLRGGKKGWKSGSEGTNLSGGSKQMGRPAGRRGAGRRGGSSTAMTWKTSSAGEWYSWRRMKRPMNRAGKNGGVAHESSRGAANGGRWGIGRSRASSN